MPDLTVAPQTTFRDIQQNFAGLDPKMGEKHLRMDGGRGLHLHDTGKWSGIGAKAAERRAMKHGEAFEAVKKSIDAQLGTPGMGELILRNVLTPQQFGKKMISVDDLARIGNLVEEHGAHFAKVDAVMEQLAPRIGDEGIVAGLRERLRQDSSIDLDALLAQARKPVGGEPPNKPALERDLKDANMGLLQALARHGVIDDKMGHDKRMGYDVHVGRGPDSEGLRYGHIGSQSKKVEGNAFDSEPFKGFVVCKSHELALDEEGVRFKKTGDKVHLSVAPKDVGRAWDTVMPILLKYPDVVREFKVTDMSHVQKEVDDCRVKLAEMERTPPPRDESTNARFQRENRMRMLKDKIESGERVTQGAQVTLYFHHEGGGVPMARARAMMDEITRELGRSGVEPGLQPGSDHRVTAYASYRNEVRENGKALMTDAPDYEVEKAKMVHQPLFKALTSGA